MSLELLNRVDNVMKLRLRCCLIFVLDELDEFVVVAVVVATPSVVTGDEGELDSIGSANLAFR